MKQAVGAQPKFWYLTETVILAALNKRDAQSSIAAEVARLVLNYTEALRTQPTASTPSLPPRWPIEAVALRVAKALVQ